jgi:hypothetical protein
MNLGPRTDVLDNEAEGHWRLSAYSIRGLQQAIANIPGKALLKIERAEVKADSTYPSLIYVNGYSYRIFLFSDMAKANVSKTMAISYGHDYSKKRKEETHWFRLDDDYGFQVVLNLKNGTSTRMEMSNIMKSESYRTELDTATYIYVADPP